VGRINLRLAQEKFTMEIEELLQKSFCYGVLKITDPNRFQSIDDLARAVRVFCSVVKVRQADAGVQRLTKMFSQCVKLLEEYVSLPTENQGAVFPGF
jgi:hypothetical protein